MLLCEVKFLVPNYSCLQNPDLSLFCPQLNLLNPPKTKFLGMPLCHVHISTDLSSLRPLKQLWTLVLRMPVIEIIQYMSKTFVLRGTYFVTCSVYSQENGVCACELGACTSTGVSKYRSTLW